MKKINSVNFYQKGFMLMEMLLAISIGTLIIASSLSYQQQEHYQKTASLYGKQIAEYSMSVRAALVVDGANMLLAGSPKVGVNWLKTNDGTCPGGAAAQAFLSCNFAPQLFFGVDLDALPIASRTTVVSNGALPNPIYSSATIFPGVTIGGQARPDLTGLAVQAANLYDRYDQASNFVGGNVSYVFNRALNTITATISADSGADMFLRRDGTNSMTGALNMGNNDVINSANYTGIGNITNTGNINNTGDINNIGNTTVGSLVNNGALTQIGAADVRGGIANSIGNVTINDNLSTAGTLSATGDISANSNLTVLGATTLGNTSSTNLTVTAATDLQGAVSNTTANNGGNLLLSDNTTITGVSDLQNTITNDSVNNGGRVRINDDVEVGWDAAVNDGVVDSKKTIYVSDVDITSVTLGGGASYAPLSGAVVYSGIFAADALVPKPGCTAPMTAQIFVSPAVFHANGDPVFGVVGYALDQGANWQVKVESMDSTSTMVSAGHATVFVKCT